MLCTLRIAVVMLVAGLYVPALAWTPAIDISHASGNERSTPRIACGPDGTLNVVYINKGSPWSTYFRQRSAAGVWGPIEKISSVFTTRPDVCQDLQGRVHVIYAAQPSGGQLDLYHTIRQGGSWSGSYITSTSQYEDQPRMLLDPAGTIHLVFTRTNVESSSGDVVYRTWQNGVWSGDTLLGQVTNSYYNRPDITRDASGTLHVVWAQRSGSVWKVRYRRFSGGTWSATQDIGSGAESDNHFFAYPRVATAGSGVVVVWHSNTGLWHNISLNGGASWTYPLSGTMQGQFLHAGHYPQMDSGPSGAHLVAQDGPGTSLLYARFSGGAWTVLQQVIAGPPGWKGWPDVVEDPSGVVHTVWDRAYGSSTSDHRIDYAASAADSTPPGSVLNFTAIAMHNRVRLGWTNPSDPDFERTIVRFKTTGFPTDPGDGTLLTDAAAAPGSSQTVDHICVVNGTLYYYAAFARDTGGLYATGVTASARPSVPADLDRDGDVDQTDFGLLQACLAGPNVSPGPGCTSAMLDGDFDVDSADVAAFLACMSGPDTPYEPTCADGQ